MRKIQLSTFIFWLWLGVSAIVSAYFFQRTPTRKPE